MVLLKSLSNRAIYILSYIVGVADVSFLRLLGHDDRIEKNIFELRASGDRLLESLKLLYLPKDVKSKELWYVKKGRVQLKSSNSLFSGKRLQKSSLHTGRHGGHDSRNSPNYNKKQNK